jgi:hypothetical protein
VSALDDLADVLCRQDPKLWDDTTDPQPAIDRCLYQCRAYDACRQWAQTQAADTLVGVIAGEVYLHPSDRRERAS